MKIAVTLVHNKPDNEAQIDAVLSLVKRVTDTVTQDQVDEEGNVTGQESFDIYHYEFTDLTIPHEVRFYHVVPFGVPRPANLDQLDGHKVLYGPEDQDKTETRFFNWGLKRGTDHGADISLYLEDVSKLKPKDLAKTLGKLTDKADKTEFSEETCGKFATVKLLREVGQLDESKGKVQAISEYKQKIVEGGLKAK